TNLNEIARAALEAVMDFHNYEYQSDFAKKYLAQGYREMLRTLLQQRFGALPAEAEARLDAADGKTLKAWASRVLTAASLADVFDSESR
ncbi:MAG TPA: hypothetical protein VNM90_15865, partial [Haliangium sp.]|nr:hypothetical protein [Haliangium sp.]